MNNGRVPISQLIRSESLQNRCYHRLGLFVMFLIEVGVMQGSLRLQLKIHDSMQAAICTVRAGTVYILNIRADKTYHAQSDQDEHSIYYILCRNTNRGFQEVLDVGDEGMRRCDFCNSKKILKSLVVSLFYPLFSFLD